MAGRLVGFKVQEVWLIPAVAVCYEGSAHRAPLDQPARPQLKHILHAIRNPGSLVEQFRAHESGSGLGIQYDAGTHARERAYQATVSLHARERRVLVLQPQG